MATFKTARMWAGVVNGEPVEYEIVHLQSVRPSLAREFLEGAPLPTDFYNGYATFKSCPLAEEGYNGEAASVDVNGGITYAEHVEGGYKYGFDCGHRDDLGNPDTRNLDKLTEWCESMATQIIQLAKRANTMSTNEHEEVTTEYVVEEYDDGGETKHCLVQRVRTPLECHERSDELDILALILNQGKNMVWIEFSAMPDDLVELCAENGYELDSHSREEGKYILVFRRSDDVPESKQFGVSLVPSNSYGSYSPLATNRVSSDTAASWVYSTTSTALVR